MNCCIFATRFSPIGICSLIAAKVAGMKDIIESLNMVGLYMATVIAGLLIHALIIIPLLYLIVVRKNPIRYMIGLRDAIITAFGTSSRYMWFKIVALLSVVLVTCWLK